MTQLIHKPPPPSHQPLPSPPPYHPLQVLGVTQLINKRGANNAAFGAEDAATLDAFAQQVGAPRPAQRAHLRARPSRT